MRTGGSAALDNSAEASCNEEAALASGAALAVVPGVDGVELSSPVFGLTTNPDGSLLAAETLAGVTEIRKGSASLIASLGGVSGVASVGGGNLFAVTGAAMLAPQFASNSKKLFRVSRGNVRLIADLGAYEAAVNPDQSWNPLAPDSNPFNVEHLNGGNVLVADAAANAVLMVDAWGGIDWVAVLTPKLVSTAPLKDLIGCPGSGAPQCGLPDAMSAQPVATSVAVGPDGSYYAGELIGFPGTPGESRVWRIAAGSRHVLCPSAACTLFADGFTSIMDLAVGADGTVYVVEFDEVGWLGVEIVSGGFPIGPAAGGTVNACDASGSCSVWAGGLDLPTAVTVGRDGTVFVVENSSIPGGTSTVRAIN